MTPFVIMHQRTPSTVAYCTHWAACPAVMSCWTPFASIDGVALAVNEQDVVDRFPRSGDALLSAHIRQPRVAQHGHHRVDQMGARVSLAQGEPEEVSTDARGVREEWAWILKDIHRPRVAETTRACNSVFLLGPATGRSAGWPPLNGFGCDPRPATAYWTGWLRRSEEGLQSVQVRGRRLTSPTRDGGTGSLRHWMASKMGAASMGSEAARSATVRPRWRPDRSECAQ